MTTYGTISTEAPELSNQSLSARIKQFIESGFGAPRPWDDVIQFQSLNIPTSFNDLIERIQTNAAVFRMNYAIIVFSIIFVSLFWNPVSLIFSMILIASWMYLYFLREGDKFMIYGYEIDGGILITVLFLGTVGVFLLTDIMKNILIGLFIGTVVIVMHAGLRNTDDAFAAGDDVERLGLFQNKVCAAAPAAPLPLKHTASSSFSSS